jgi:hypothetical protein
MGTCVQIKTRFQTVRTRLPANCDVALVDSELRMLFLDFKFRDINKRDLDEKEKIGCLANAFELHSDHRMKQCSNQINHDCITIENLTYEIAVTRFTSVEICINTQRMDAQLALTLSNQYNLQNDHHRANSLDHEERVSIIQQQLTQHESNQYDEKGKDVRVLGIFFANGGDMKTPMLPLG